MSEDMYRTEDSGHYLLQLPITNITTEDHSAFPRQVFVSTPNTIETYIIRWIAVIAHKKLSKQGNEFEMAFQASIFYYDSRVLS